MITPAAKTPLTGTTLEELTEFMAGHGQKLFRA
jgi:hypothetical protein